MITETTTEPTLAECFARAAEAAAEFGPPERITVFVQHSLARHSHNSKEIKDDWNVTFMNLRHSRSCEVGTGATFEEAFSRCLEKCRKLPPPVCPTCGHEQAVKP